MNLTGISQELNFSEEVLSNANALTELRKDGLVKLNFIHQKIKKLNKKKYNQQFEDYKKEILEVLPHRTFTLIQGNKSIAGQGDTDL